MFSWLQILIQTISSKIQCIFKVWHSKVLVSYSTQILLNDRFMLCVFIFLGRAYIHTRPQKEKKINFSRFSWFQLQNKIFPQETDNILNVLLPLSPLLVVSPWLSFASSDQTYQWGSVQCILQKKGTSVLACYNHCSVVGNFLKTFLLIHQDFHLLFLTVE